MVILLLRVGFMFCSSEKMSLSNTRVVARFCNAGATMAKIVAENGYKV